jgi:phenylpropionate dioxygenase-like ring-hydroxylating dioxygenase large terminal subunit
MIDDPLLVNDWHPVASLEQLAAKPVQAMRLLGEDLVIWKGTTGYQAWQDLCVHRGSKLSLGKVFENDCLRCPYHGWTYASDGHCVQMPAHPDQTPPAKARVKTYQVKEGYGLLWVCLGTPTRDLPPFPEWGQPGFAKAVCGPFAHVRANGPRLIENYLDAAHFPFVHEGVLGDPNRPEMEDFEARITPQGVESDPIYVYQPDPYGGTSGKVSYTYHAYRPLTAHFTKHIPLTTGGLTTNGMMLTITPHDVLDSTAWFLVATTARDDDAAFQDEYTPRIGAIFEEDRAIVESQRPELLPLDLQAELHLKSDRVAIAYRMWLRELGLRFGVE